jgi:hypothetical protein
LLAPRVVPLLDFTPEVGRVIDTTNQIEALHSSLRKLRQHRSHPPNDEAVTKILYLALRRLEQKWERTLWNCSAVLGQLAVFFRGRIPALQGLATTRRRGAATPFHGHSPPGPCLGTVAMIRQSWSRSIQATR